MKANAIKVNKIIKKHTKEKNKKERETKNDNK